MNNSRGCTRKVTINQYGAALLMTVTLLLLIITLTTLYTGRSQSFEHQIIVNSQNHKWATFAAQSGIQKGFALLNVHKGWVYSKAVNEIMDDKNTFVIDAVSQVVQTNVGQRVLITLQSTGTSADGLATAAFTEQAIIYPVLVNTPAAPLIVQGGFDGAGRFVVVANPYVKQPSVLISTWSNKAVILTGTQNISCSLLEYKAGKCAANSLSNSAFQSSDIVDNSLTFPADVMGYLFNVPTTEYITLKHQANNRYSDCQQLNSLSRGLIWVSGVCKVSLGEQIGSLSHPTVLIVEDGDIEFDKNVTFHGVLFSFQSTSQVQHHQIIMHAGARVLGAVVANHPLGANMDHVFVVHDGSVLSALLKQPEMLRVARVPGAWRDF